MFKCLFLSNPISLSLQGKGGDNHGTITIVLKRSTERNYACNILNIQRACEASIDLAMHVVAERKLGIPKASREGFDFLQKADVIEEELARSLINMVEFRNIAIHDYQALNLDNLQVILEKHIDDFKSYSKIILRLEKEKL